MSGGGGLTRNEAQQLARDIARHGWRVEEQTRARHYLAYPPEGGRPVGFSVSTDRRARTNVYAAFRRAGLELDPARAQRKRRAA
jgi:hypothetical protein